MWDCTEAKDYLVNVDKNSNTIHVSDKNNYDGIRIDLKAYDEIGIKIDPLIELKALRELFELQKQLTSSETNRVKYMALRRDYHDMFDTNLKYHKFYVRKSKMLKAQIKKLMEEIS